MSIRPYLTPANAITSTSLAAGFLALVALGHGQLGTAVALVSVAAVLDSVDGAVARRAGGDRTFGTNLDSLADLVAFGVVPAMAAYLGPLQLIPVLGTLACLAYLVSGAWRLARFPIVKRSHCFVGLPIPVSGMVLMYALLLDPMPSFALVLTLLVSVLMMSTLHFPTLNGARLGTVTLVRSRSERRVGRR